MIEVEDIISREADMKLTFEAQQETALKWRTSTAKERIGRLTKIKKYLKQPQNIDRLLDALAEDLKKSEVEAMTSEIMVAIHSLDYVINNLKAWMRPREVSPPLTAIGAQCQTIHEPKGVALIIAPWNYPFQLAINPIVYALAAGCPVILKPSEYSVATSSYLVKMFDDLFDSSEVKVYTGGVDTSQTLLQLPFNHMYFTGSTTVGKIVMRAAAEHLSSVTLELGGKSPCIIDPKISISAVADRIIWGKYYNNGQTCIAPDHLYVHESKVTATVEALTKSITKLYGTLDGLPSNPDYGRIISDRHHQRALDLISDAVQKGATIAYGGSGDPVSRYIQPTILTEVSPDAEVMQEEVFAPILPILTYDSEDQVIEAINSRPKPLALYVMSKRSDWTNHIINRTSAGTTVVNDFLIQYANHKLPFGGINASGVGKSHGWYGFMAFTNERSLVKQRLAVTRLMHPPYSPWKEKLAKFMTRWL
jgi:aldehyde dehydrogenase (NAD+)